MANPNIESCPRCDGIGELTGEAPGAIEVFSCSDCYRNHSHGHTFYRLSTGQVYRQWAAAQRNNNRLQAEQEARAGLLENPQNFSGLLPEEQQELRDELALRAEAYAMFWFPGCGDARATIVELTGYLTYATYASQARLAGQVQLAQQWEGKMEFIYDHLPAYARW